jgi:hypothetical protein
MPKLLWTLHLRKSWNKKKFGGLQYAWQSVQCSQTCGSLAALTLNKYSRMECQHTSTVQLAQYPILAQYTHHTGCYMSGLFMTEENCSVVYSMPLPIVIQHVILPLQLWTFKLRVIQMKSWYAKTDNSIFLYLRKMRSKFWIYWEMH